MRTRSLQSPPVLVNPHATWPLLPTTRLGDARQRDAGDPLRGRRPIGSGNTIEARYQMIGTPIDRCMSLATIAPGRAVRAVDGPVVAADDGFDFLTYSHGSTEARNSSFSLQSSQETCPCFCVSVARVRCCADRTRPAPGIGGRGIGSPTTGVSHSDPAVERNRNIGSGSVSRSAPCDCSNSACRPCSVLNIASTVRIESSGARAPAWRAARGIRTAARRARSIPHSRRRRRRRAPFDRTARPVQRAVRDVAEAMHAHPLIDFHRARADEGR